LLPLLLLGFLLGLRHATDPDHVVAVTTIVARDRRPWASSLIGALWGIGHTVTIFVVGGAIILFDVVIPPRLGLGMELAVAIMLIALGTVNLAGLRAHAHPPGHASSPAPRIGLRPLLVGVVHGLAGSAAVTLLVLATIHDQRWALLYLGVFGVGTIAGMMTLTTALGLPFAYASRRFDRLQAWLAGSTGLASVAFGGFLAYELVVVHGLLSAAPQWSPY